MYQMQISVSLKNAEWLYLLKKELNSVLKKYNALSSNVDTKYRATLSIAFQDNDNFKLKELEPILCKFFLKHVKKDYLLSKIKKFSSNPFLLNIYVHVLKEFNKTEEERELKSKMVVFNNFALDGFYNFRMNNVKNMWNDLVLLTEDNADLIKEESSFKLLLKYMISCLPSKTEETKIDYKYNKFVIKSGSQTKVVKEKEDVIYSLIDIAPTRIVLTNSAGKTNIDSMIFGIFDANRV